MHPKTESELNDLEAPDELRINSVTQQATQQNSEEPNPTCHLCKKPGHYGYQCRQLEREKDPAPINTNSADNNNNYNSGQTNSNCNNKTSNKPNANSIKNQGDRRPRPVYPPCQTCGKTNNSTKKCYFRANVANRPPLQNRQ